MSRGWSPRAVGLSQVAVASVGFGFLGIFGKAAFRSGLTVGEVLTARFALAALVLGIGLALFRRHDLRIGRKQILLSLVLGLLGYAVFATLYFLAIRGLSVPLAVLLLYTFPFWTLLFNAFIGERPTMAALAGLLGALTGLAMILWGEFRIDSLEFALCGIGSAITYALYVIVAGRLQKNVPALGSGFWVIVGGALGLALFHRPSPERLLNLTAEQAGPVTGLAVIGTILPLVLIQAGLRRLTSTETALLSMIEPVTAWIAAFAILHESISSRQTIGGLLVLASLALVAARGSNRDAVDRPADTRSGN